MGEGKRRTEREAVLRLMAEAGVSAERVRIEHVLAQTLKLLIVAGLGVIVVGIALGSELAWAGVALSGGAFIAFLAIASHRLRVLDKVRWQDGTVTFRTIEPRNVDESGQSVVCDVELNPPLRVVRVATTVGPLDAERLVVGATMRCQVDRLDFPVLLRAFPYAAPDAPLPAGRELAFRKA